MEFMRYLIFCIFLFGGCAFFRTIGISDEVHINEDIFYRGTGNPKHQMNIYGPKKYGKAPYPVVVFIHGGYWRNQDRNYYKAFVGLYENIGLTLAQKGFVTVIPSYRLFPEAKIDNQLSDLAHLMSWVVKKIKNYAGNPNKIILMGHSAGGHLAALMGLNKKILGPYHKNVVATVALSGIWDIPHLVKNTLEKEIVPELIQPHFGKKRSRQLKYSPISYLPGELPLYIAYGEKDTPTILKQHKILKMRFPENKKRKYLRVAGYEHADMVTKITDLNNYLVKSIVPFMSNALKNSN